MLKSDNSNLTPLQRAQFNIQLTWLEDGTVPEGEFIAKSNGVVNPANNTKYLSMVSGLMVSRCWWNEKKKLYLPMFQHPLSRGTIVSIPTYCFQRKIKLPESSISTAQIPLHIRSLILTTSLLIMVRAPFLVNDPA